VRGQAVIVASETTVVGTNRVTKAFTTGVVVAVTVVIPKARGVTVLRRGQYLYGKNKANQ